MVCVFTKLGHSLGGENFCKEIITIKSYAEVINKNL